MHRDLHPIHFLKHSVCCFPTDAQILSPANAYAEALA